VTPRARLAILVSRIALVLSTLLAFPATAGAGGHLVVVGDDWPTSNTYFDASSQAFTLNVFGWLTQTAPLKRVLLDDQFDHYLSYSQMVNALISNGYSVSRSPTSTWNTAYLNQYDVVLLENSPVDSTALVDFVDCGGSAYVVGGGGNSDVLYNQFLSAFGLSFSPYVDLSAPFTNFVAHPVTVGVTSLTADRPTPINVLAPGPQVLCSQYGENFLAIDAPVLLCRPTPTRPHTWGELKSSYR